MSRRTRRTPPLNNTQHTAICDMAASEQTGQPTKRFSGRTCRALMDAGLLQWDGRAYCVTETGHAYAAQQVAKRRFLEVAAKVWS